MENIEHSIEVDAPISTVYNQWTQFEEFPEFMEGIEQVRQLDDKRLHWVSNIAGHRDEWDAEIYEQTPDQLIAWRSIGGRQNEGEVRFERVSDTRTRIHVRISYQPEGAMQKVGSAMGVASGRVKGDLKRFKEFIETRGRESGGWRGEIRGGQPTRGSQSGDQAARSKRLYGEQSGSVSASGTSDTGMGNQ